MSRYGIIASAILLTGCMQDVSEPGAPDNGTSVSGIPDSFDFSTTQVTQIAVKVADEYNGRYYYTVEVYDADPVDYPDARLLAGGKTNKNKPFEVEVELPSTQKELYIRQITPAGYKFVSTLEVTGSNLVLDYNNLKAPETTTKAVASDYNQQVPATDALFAIPENAEEITNNGDRLEKNGIYKITSDYDGEIRFPDGQFTLYVSKNCKLRLNKKEYELKNGAEIYVSEGASIEANGGQEVEIKLEGESKIFNAGEIRVHEIEMDGNSVLYNHPGGKIDVHSLETDGSQIHNNCLIRVADEFSMEGAGSNLYLNSNSSLLSKKCDIDDGAAACGIYMKAKALFQTDELECEKTQLPIYGDQNLALADCPLFWVNDEIDCGYYNINFYWQIAVYASKIDGAIAAFYRFEDDKLPVDMQGECYGATHTPVLPDTDDSSKDDEYNEDEDKKMSFTYIFEDSWPSFGDYDMNDAVMDIKVTNQKDKWKKYFTISTTFRAVGAGKPLYAYARLKTDGAQETLIPLADQELHALMGIEIGQFVNTYTPNCENVTVKKQIALPEGSKGYISSKDLDVFIVWGDIAGKQWNEVHLAGETETSRAKQADSSVNYKYKAADETDGEFDNMMWGLKIPSKKFTAYPKEGVSIMQAYPGFTLWAKSGGEEHKDWYTKPAGAEYLYQEK